MRRQILILIALALAGCTQLPPTPQDVQAKKFEAVSDKAVIYVVRDVADFSDLQSEITLGDKLSLKTYKGTYYRWVVPPGKHTISGYGQDIGTISVNAERDRIYYVAQSVTGRFGGPPSSQFYLLDEQKGRAAVLRAVLLVPMQPMTQ